MAGSFLIKRGGTYYFKRTVPPNLVPLIGRKVWRESLKVTTLGEAQDAVAPMIELTSFKLREARRELARQRQMAATLTPDEYAALQRSGGLNKLRTETGTMARSILFMKAAITAKRNDDSDPAMTEDDLELEIVETEARVASLRKQLQRNRTILHKADAKPAEDDWAVAADAAPLMDIKALAEKFAKRGADPSQHLSEQHAGQYRHPAKLFVEHQGPLPLDKITKDHLRAWRDALGSLPRTTKQEYRTATMPQVIAMAEKAGVARITPQTGAKNFGAIKTLLKFAVAEGYLSQNPAEGLTYPLPKGKKSGEKRKMPFSPEQLKALLPAIAEEHDKTEDDFWIPLVALHQGMRLEEVCQLLKTDIAKDKATSVQTIQITDEAEGQRVKNVASVRTVPLHPALIEMGFLDHVERSPGPRVFATLKPDNRGRYGGPYSKRFARILRDKAKIKDPLVTFHSTRHTWRDAARDAEVPLEVVYRLGGWTEGGNPVAAGYGRGVSLEVMAKWLGKIKPIDADGGDARP